MKQLYRALSVITLAAMLVMSPGSTVNAQTIHGDRQFTSPPQQASDAANWTNRIIVKYKETAEPVAEGDPARAAEALSARAGVSMSYLRTMADDAQVMELPERLPLEQVQALSEQLMALPDVEYAEPDKRFRITLTPNDPLYADQWHYKGTFGINAPTAWNTTTGLTTTVVAVVDTGITSHVDLNGRSVPGYDFVNTALDGNDGNGRDSDPSDPGDWITVAEDNGTANNHYFEGCGVSDSSWHGTHVAGTIAANSNNNVGVAGINWKAKILPVRVLGKCGGWLSDIADGIRWAAGLPVSGVPANANPARVINVSIGGEGQCSESYQNAINSVNAAGAIVVVAAGNENVNVSNSEPANCSGVIAVAATASDGWRAPYSNFGALIDISAPGGDFSFDTGVLSTSNTGTTVPVAATYIANQGTSMATPHVSGVISLMLAVNPYLTSSQVLQIIQSTAKAFAAGGSCNTSICGPGIVNASAALGAVTPQTFMDVSTTYWAWDYVERLYDAGITGGCSAFPAMYCPAATVTRAEMAVFLERGIHGSNYTPPSVGGSTGFTDVPTNYWAAAWIKQFANDGITSGCGIGIYCPNSPVTRAEMAIFLLRAEHGSSYIPPSVGGTTGFADVPVGHWADRWIKQLAAEGITGGCGGSNYCPQSPVSRAEMAVFLVKTFNLP